MAFDQRPEDASGQNGVAQTICGDEENIHSGRFGLGAADDYKFVWTRL
jgi:hypothetical protein